MQILLSALFINNIVLLSFLGLEGVLNNTKKSIDTFGIIVSSIFIMLVSSFANYWIYDTILKPNDLQVLVILIFSTNVILMSFVVAWFLKSFLTIIYLETKNYIPIAAVSSLILGVSILNIEKGIDIYNYTYINLCNALGFGLIIVVLTAIRDRLLIANLPKSIIGAPILLITLGLISMAFMGFKGIGHL